MVYSRTSNIQKLDEKSKRGILVSFGAKQYKILDTTRNKTFQARDAIVLEGCFKNLESNSNLNSDSKHLELEVANSNPQGSPPSQQPENDAKPNPDSLPRQPDMASQDIAPRRQNQLSRTIPTRAYRQANTPLKDLSKDELALCLLPDPTTYQDTRASPNRDKWQAAMEKELADLASQKTWELVDLPSKRKTLRSRQIYETKINKDGKINEYKARQIVKGFLQKHGIVKLIPYKTLFALATQNNLKIQQWDVKLAFPNTLLNKPIYVEQPYSF